MKQEQFEQSYQNFWAELEATIAQLEKSDSDEGTDVKALPLDAFPSAYRRVCNHLAIAKKRRYSARVIKRLNYLVLKSHQHLYQRKTNYFYHSVQFVLAEFPCCLRRNAAYFWAATGLFYLPGFIVFALVLFHPEFVYSFMSPMQILDFEAMYDPTLEKLGRERQSDTDFAMFGYYIYNNIGIAFQTFASGLLAAVGSMFYLVYNGVLIGGVSGHILVVDYGETFFPFIVGHGSFELTAITIAGAAGMKLGVSILAPQNLSRLESLKKASQDGIKLIIGAALMLLFAAFIEAYWSSIKSFEPYVKYGVGAALWVLVIVYLYRAGRGSYFES